MKEIISENHIKALQLIIPTFQRNNIAYQVTGGLAGNLYGSKWQLHDIDIEVAQKDIDKVILVGRDNDPKKFLKSGALNKSATYFFLSINKFRGLSLITSS